MKVMVSIKPEYVERILAGEKTYEFRRRIFKRDDVDTLVVYATRPKAAVVAEVRIEGVVEASPEELWKKTHKTGGISRTKFMRYFEGADSAFAIRLGRITRFDRPVPLDEYPSRITKAPQSFAYVQ